MAWVLVAAKKLGEGGGYLDAFFGCGVEEDKAIGVEAEAVNLFGKGGLTTIEKIAEDGVPEL